jgi:hypothetical protein
MFGKVACAGLVLAIGVGVALADEFNASIRKVEDGKVTFVKRVKGQKPDEGTAVTLPTSADVKVLNGKFNKDTKTVEAGEALSGGLKNERFSNIGERGVPAHLITSEDGKTITEIRVFQFRKKGTKPAA